MSCILYTNMIKYYLDDKAKTDYINYITDGNTNDAVIDNKELTVKYLFSRIQIDIISYCIFLLPMLYILLLPRNIFIFIYTPQSSLHFITNNIYITYTLNVLLFIVISILFTPFIHKKWSKESLISETHTSHTDISS